MTYNDEGYEVRSIFMDISNTIDKVWHKDSLFKLSQNSISGSLLNVLSNFFSNRTKKVVPNGQTSMWENINAGIPQDSILGPLLLLIYINGLSDCLSSKATLFADDASLSHLHQELSLESLQHQRWYKKFFFFYKMLKNKSPSYLFNLHLTRNLYYSFRNVVDVLFLRLNIISSQTIFFHHLKLNGTN